MKLWIDDERPVPDDTWVLASSALEAQSILSDPPEELEHVSFDYVLGHGEYGDNLMHWMFKQGIYPNKVTVHSSGGSANALMIYIAKRNGVEATVF